MMTIVKHELKRGRLSVGIWSAAIAFLVLICILLFPEMKGEMDSVTDLFASMGNFTAAFGMDRLNFGEAMGFYGVECGNILGIGGALFSALLGISALASEEKNHTAEFLLTHPIRRSQVVAEKGLAMVFQLLILNGITVVVALAGFVWIGEKVSMREFWLLHLAYFLLQVNIAALCFGVSALIRRGGPGIGMGLALGLYFCHLIANLSDKAEFLNYITPFGYADAADIIEKGRIDSGLLLLGAVYSLAAVAAAFWHYSRKDIAA